MENTLTKKLKKRSSIVLGAPVKVNSWTGRKDGWVYSEADIGLMNGRSKGKNVHETLLKYGLDYLADSARAGIDIDEKLSDVMGRAYDGRYEWVTDYQTKLMNALKEGGLF